MTKRWFARLVLTFITAIFAGTPRPTSAYPSDFVFNTVAPLVAPIVAAAEAPTTPSAGHTSVVTVTAVVPAYVVDWSATTPALSQGGLLDGFACAPTALSMVTVHYSGRYPVGSRSAQEFIANLKPGDYIAGQGVPYQRLAAQIYALGYRSVTGHTGSSQAELRRLVSAGPTIVTAGGTVAGARASHSLVVTAISIDGNWVKLNDPASGSNHTLSWAKFDALWAGGSRGVLIITP